MKITIKPWLFFALIISIATAGCGFQLRGKADIPYTSLYVEGNGAVVNNLRQLITAGGHKSRLAQSGATAQRTIQILSETSTMIIIALSSAGYVSEYQLQYRVKYRVLKHNKEVLAPVEIALSRDMSYNNTQPYAYAQEESFLTQDMQNDAAQQILLRIALSHDKKL